MGIIKNDNAPGQGGEVSTALIEQSEFIYPFHETQPARLLATLLTKQRVNPLKGWRHLGIYRLSDTVYQLRGMNWPVITDRLDVNNRFEEKCHVAEYFLPVESIEAAGHEGQDFASEELAIMAKGKRA